MTAVRTTSATAVTEATSPRNATAQAVNASVLVPALNDERYIDRRVAAGPVSRAVALGLASRLGRGGSRKWGEQRLASDAEWELDTGVFAGVWERETLLEYGGWDERWVRNEDSEMAGRFLARGERLVCLASMGADYVPRDSLAGL